MFYKIEIVCMVGWRCINAVLRRYGDISYVNHLLSLYNERRFNFIYRPATLENFRSFLSCCPFIVRVAFLLLFQSSRDSISIPERCCTTRVRCVLDIV